MPQKKYLVDVSVDECESLRQLVRRGPHASRTVPRARMLLLVADGGPDEPSVTPRKTAFATVARTRVVEEGLGCLNERPRRGHARQLTGKQEAPLLAVTCSMLPTGHARWTLRRLADNVVELPCADSLAPETVHQVLKKTHCSRG
jgi:hypothetical protein